MLESSVRAIAVVCTALVVISFALFARDQISGASQGQQEEIVTGQTVVPSQSSVHKRRGQPRRFIDGAAGKLESPFSGIVHTSSSWVREIVPTVLAVLVYGFLLSYLGRYMRGRAKGAHGVAAAP